MDSIEIASFATPELSDPVVVEGLPGVGLVGKLAADHLVQELESQPVRRVYSEYFPPAVAVDDGGVATLASLTIDAIETEGRDLLVLTGDIQAQGTMGQYRVADGLLDIAGEFGVDQIVALGGFGTGQQVEEYTVLGAVGAETEELRTKLEAGGVEFERDEAPENIVGMSGVLVGLGALRGYETAGLLGITPGYHVDPASARAVLAVLQDAFGFTVDLDTLEEQAKEIQNILEQVQERQQPQQSGQGGEDLRYFG